MMTIDWTSVGVGLAVGAVCGALFFAGLGLGLRLALRTQQPVQILLLSTVLRISAVLAVGWGVVSQGGPWVFAGFVLSFLVVRTIATTVVRSGIDDGRAS
jgi:F1F0 ATPase subunit 2